MHDDLTGAASVELDDLTTWDYIAGIGAILCVPVVIFFAGMGVGWLIWA